MAGGSASAFEGTLRNGSPITVSNPSVAIFPLNRVGRPLGAGLASETRALARTVWDFELFAAEETVDVQGQKVTISRGVTVGKSVGAALLFVIGYLLAASVARTSSAPWPSDSVSARPRPARCAAGR